MSLACLAHVNFLLHMYFDLITEQMNDDDNDDGIEAPGPLLNLAVPDAVNAVTSPEPSLHMARLQRITVYKKTSPLRTPLSSVQLAFHCGK